MQVHDSKKGVSKIFGTLAFLFSYIMTLDVKNRKENTMLVNFTKYDGYKKIALRSEDISRIEDDFFHSNVIMKSGERIEILETFKEANEKLNRAILTEGTETGAEEAIESRRREVRKERLYNKISNRLDNRHRI